MSILANLTRAQKAHRQQPQLMSEAELIAEYNAARRAYAAALASNDVAAALLWSERAVSLARQMAQMQDYQVSKVAYRPLSDDKQEGHLRAWCKLVFNAN